MSIPFDVPAEFLPHVLSGNYVRYGAILKDVSTGQIVGHLKEVGGLTTGLPGAAIFPQLVQSAQLAHIQQTLNALKLVATVGAVASVASLGVSIAGFAVVAHKLRRIEGKIDQLANELGCIRDCIKELGTNSDALTLAKIDVAAEQLNLAITSSDETRWRGRAEEAILLFSQMRRLNWRLFNLLDPWNRYDVPPKAALELFSRACTCSLGQLEAEFLVGDSGTLERTWAQVLDESRQAANFNLKEAYRSRSDGAIRRGLAFQTATITEDLPARLSASKLIADETVARIDTLKIEAEYVRRLGITPREYVRELQQIKEPNVVLLPCQKDPASCV